MDSQLRTFFQAIDTDHSGFLTPDELGRALVNGNWQPFHPETIRLLFRLFDHDRDNRITFQEFVSLWKYIDQWKQCFQQFDQDNSGTIDRQELRKALYTFGFNVSEQVIQHAIASFDRRGKCGFLFYSFLCM